MMLKNAQIKKDTEKPIKQNLRNLFKDGSSLMFRFGFTMTKIVRQKVIWQVRLWKYSPLGFAGRASPKPKACDCCPFSTGEKVRMRAS